MPTYGHPDLWITPQLKELIRWAAEREHRTTANFMEAFVRNRCREHGIAVPAKHPYSCSVHRGEQMDISQFREHTGKRGKCVRSSEHLEVVAVQLSAPRQVRHSLELPHSS
ncbi:hypothetical protein F6X42_18690 [Paraburkholderia sp. WC7.3b]|uniref:Uncharacterized protein n=1 Tax=Paraburkholderia podalyriae TaxID=1938811 RepID=A0ABR7PQJ3_9BURK|nr:hypothetical protein [Paraburkholderia podalyriae]